MSVVHRYDYGWIPSDQYEGDADDENDYNEDVYNFDEIDDNFDDNDDTEGVGVDY